MLRLPSPSSAPAPARRQTGRQHDFVFTIGIIISNIVIIIIIIISSSSSSSSIDAIIVIIDIIIINVGIINNVSMNSIMFIDIGEVAH